MFARAEARDYDCYGGPATTNRPPPLDNGPAMTALPTTQPVQRPAFVAAGS